MGAKMMQVEVCGLRFVKAVNGEPTPATSNQQPRCTQCRSAVAKWDTSTNSGGGGATTVGRVRMGCRQSGERKDVQGGGGYYEV